MFLGCSCNKVTSSPQKFLILADIRFPSINKANQWIFPTRKTLRYAFDKRKVKWKRLGICITKPWRISLKPKIPLTTRTNRRTSSGTISWNYTATRSINLWTSRLWKKEFRKKKSLPARQLIKQDQWKWTKT